MKTEGKFMLFGLAEFEPWLANFNMVREVRLIQNHHTWKPGYAETHDNHFKLLASMEAYHKGRGFFEIAQNLTTFKDGTIAVCRSLNTIPAGIKGANQYGICIEHVGNFDIGGDEMTPEHRKTILGINAALCKKFSLEPSIETIVYHHWYDLDSGKKKFGLGNTKSCPGTNWFHGNKAPEADRYFIKEIKKLI
jgi:hypothetical protein